MKSNKITSYSIKLDEDKINKLEAILKSKCWDFKDVPYAHWGASSGNGVNVVAYCSGKVCIQGKGTKDFILYTLEPDVTGRAELGYTNDGVENDAGELILAFPHAGIDESGKGDFFGPLVVACVYVDEKNVQILEKSGVQDSKLIKNDKKIQLISKKIMAIVEGKFALVSIGPESYNNIYSKMKNLNKLLAWGHARALENLLEKAPECKLVLADKFGNERLIKNALMKQGRNMELIQKTKAERDIAVAAASILARAEFVKRLEMLGNNAGVTLPKGAGRNVDKVVKNLIVENGVEFLEKFGKMHFKTVTKVLDSIN
jgi:ribonuclease HIII